MKFVFLTLLWGTMSSPVYAYLDPGSASLIIQGTIAAIASGVTVISLYWARLKAFFIKSSETKDEASLDDETDT